MRSRCIGPEVSEKLAAAILGQASEPRGLRDFVEQLHCVEILASNFARSPGMIGVIAVHRMNRLHCFICIVEAQQSCSGRYKFLETGSLSNNRPPGGQIARRAVAEPP